MGSDGVEPTFPGLQSGTLSIVLTTRIGQPARNHLGRLMDSGEPRIGLSSKPASGS